MKKLVRSLLVVVMLCHSEFIFSANITTGFYLGGNAGYWESQNKHITGSGSVSFINPTYTQGASNIANALAQVATNHFSLNPYGFIGGAQAGYNYGFNDKVLFGLVIDFDGSTNSNNNKTFYKTTQLVDYDESYLGSLSFKQKINYLGTVRARLGYFYWPDFLIFATGGFAYGNVEFTADWTAQESLGVDVFPTVMTHSNSNKTLLGWVAGVGMEWFLQPNWSTMLEYSYYSLRNSHVTATLAQINSSVTPSALWGSATANTASSLSVWNIRVGFNYHF